MTEQLSLEQASKELRIATEVKDEYDLVSGGRIECSRQTRKVTCNRCRKVMLLGPNV